MSAPREVDCKAWSGSEFAIQLMGAPAGTVMIYHRGLLSRDRRRTPEVDERAREALSLFEHGWCRLAQRRIRGHENNFEYVAIKIGVDKPPDGD